tara:strand:- start:11674 stop:11973 length:300 start_codon:yes stop_codon:yes gene_type:complete
MKGSIKMSDNIIKDTCIGYLEVPVTETTWSVVSFKVHEDDLKNNDCDNMQEFIEKIQSEDVDIFDLSYDFTDWEAVDSEIQEVHLDEARGFDSSNDEIL